MTPATLLAAAATLGYAACYSLICVITPFSRCRRCQGTGKTRKPSGRVTRVCRRCDGTGRRVRAGRRLYEHLRDLHRNAH